MSPFAVEIGVALPTNTDSIATQNPWLVVLAILVASYVLARLVRWGGTVLLTRSTSTAEGDSFYRTILEEIHAPLYISIVLVGVYQSLRVLDVVESSVFLVNALTTAFVVIWTWVVVRLGARWIDTGLRRDTPYKFTPVFKNLWKITITAGAGLLLISIWNLEITPLLASAGILGIVIGLAAQETISNLIGGIALYFDETYKIGDVIRLDDDLRGTVVDVGIRSTTVRTPDNVVVSVPNSILNSTQIVNQSMPERPMRMRIPVGVAYGTDYEDVECILKEACESAPLVAESPRPQILLTEFGDSAVEFECRAYVTHPLKERAAIDQIYRRAYDAFAQAGIDIPFPQRTVSYLEDEASTRAEDGGKRRESADPVPPDSRRFTGSDAE